MSHQVAQAGLELSILLPVPPECEVKKKKKKVFDGRSCLIARESK
jgi:hypothetical protein